MTTCPHCQNKQGFVCGVHLNPYVIELVMEIGSDDSWYVFQDVDSGGEDYRITIPFQEEKSDEADS